jgi:rhamnogalacturonyl hydrolase YesR
MQYMRIHSSFRNYIGSALIAVAVTGAAGQQPAPSNRQGRSTPRQLVGDDRDDSPLAKDLSPELKRHEIEKAMKKVADWQLPRFHEELATDWTGAVLETGLVMASDTLHDPKYLDAVKLFAIKNDWQLGPRLAHADDHAVGQSYLRIYELEHEPQMIAGIKRVLDEVKAQPDNPANPLWWWCDALFMDPPVWSGLTRVTGDRSYLDFMDRHWWVTAAKLYDEQEHLFSRDENFLAAKEANGRRLFWLRGNGWVLAGLARTLANMPEAYPARGKYLRIFRDMAQTFRAQQMPDGLWRPGLLDEQAYPLPESSGSALVTYALAWGIHHKLLKKSEFMPVVKNAWKGLVSHIYEDGRLGCIQPIGARPDAYQPTSSYVYGVGAFLLAASELDAVAKR